MLLLCLLVGHSPAQTYTVLHEFNGDDGILPSPTLTLSEGTLYGTTINGGPANFGTVFKVNTNGSGFSVLKTFSTNDNEAYAWGGVIASAGRLYGALWGGGTPTTCGAVFTLNPDGSGYSVLHRFSGSDGRAPMGTLLASGTTLFGTTYEGGSFGYGTVFKINTDGSDFSVLKEFTGSDGAYPRSGLVSSGTTLYGTVANRGSAGGGVLFRMNMDGSEYTVLKDFSGTDGSWPSDHLLLSGTTLYGTTRYGGSGSGTIFRINTDGSGFRVLKQFTTNDVGTDPWGGLVLGGNTLCGTLFEGGVSHYGAIFKIGTNGTGYAVLRRFNGTNEGAYPYGLVLFGTTLYGVTQRGGSSDCGLVFSLSLSPMITTAPQSQTVEAGCAAEFCVDVTNSFFATTYEWFFDATNLVGCSTNWWLELTNCDFSQSGAYTVVVSNVFGVVTSVPAMLNVIPVVERRPVPDINLMGEAGTTLNVEYAESLGPTPNWLPLEAVNLTSPSQVYFDLTEPLPPQRYYRVWQMGTPGVTPSLGLHIVPAITLTGNVGESLRLDYINAIGPTNAWVTLDTVTLTNTSQLYFDVSTIGQPRRLYRIVSEP